MTDTGKKNLTSTLLNTPDSSELYNSVITELESLIDGLKENNHVVAGEYLRYINALELFDSKKWIDLEFIKNVIDEDIDYWIDAAKELNAQLEEPPITLNYKRALTLISHGTAQYHFLGNKIIIIHLENDYYAYISPGETHVTVTLKNNIMWYGYISSDLKNVFSEKNGLKKTILEWDGENL